MIHRLYAMRLTALLIISLFLIAGCASVGLPTAETFNQKLAVGYGTVAQIRTTTAQLVNAKKLGSADAQNVQDQADTARKGLDLASELSKSDLAAANSRLVMVTTILQAAQTYLSSKQ